MKAKDTIVPITCAETPFDRRGVGVAEEEIEMTSSLFSLSNDETDFPVERADSPTSTALRASMRRMSAKDGGDSRLPAKRKVPVWTRIRSALRPDTFAALVFFITLCLCMIAAIAIAVVMREKLQASVSDNWSSVHQIIVAVQKTLDELAAAVTSGLKIEYGPASSTKNTQYSGYIAQACSTLMLAINSGFPQMEGYLGVIVASGPPAITDRTPVSPLATHSQPCTCIIVGTFKVLTSSINQHLLILNLCNPMVSCPNT